MPFRESNQVIQEDINLLTDSNLPWEQLNGRTVFISGGSGLLASYLLKTLLSASDLYGLSLKIICVVRSLASAKQRLASLLAHPDLDVIIHNISLPLCADFPPADIIIHTASQASPKYYGIDPVGTLMPNTAGTMYLLNHAVKHGSTRFLFFSSGEVYGSPTNPHEPITENDYGYLDPLQVRSCYAESKRIGETMCAAWHHQFGIHASIVRPFHTYGPSMALDDGRVFADFVADVVNSRDITLKSDGLTKRSFCYIADATLGFLTVLFKGSPGEAYNVANPAAEITMRDLAYTLSGLYPFRKIGVTFSSHPTDNSYLKSPVLRASPSIEKLSGLGWHPSVGIEEGFRRTIESYLH